MSLTRTVSAEVLDHLAPHDPAALRSRRDLARVHRVLGTRAILARGFRSLLPAGSARAPLRILELGAGDGSLLLGVARQLARDWPSVHLCLLDRQDIVTPCTLAAYAEMGWTAQAVVADVLDWAARPDVAAPGVPPQRWDMIVTTLFLHHFDQAELDDVLTAVAMRCDRFFACEPRRSGLALLGSHLVGAIGANAVTREDAVLSVHAGFRDVEISTRWPRAGGPWQVREFGAGLFSHCVSAQRAGVCG